MITDAKYIIAQASGIPWLINHVIRKHLLVLTYHGIYDGIHRPGLMPSTFVHVDDMTKHLKSIKKKYHIINADKLLASLENGSKLPDHPALVTFDDGYESFHRLAEPVLNSLGIRSLVFIPTKYIENREPFWYDLVWFFIKHSSHDLRAWLSAKLSFSPEGFNENEFSENCLSVMKKLLPEKRDEIMADITDIISSKSEYPSSELLNFYPMTDTEIRELADRGTSFGGHTHSHTILSVMPDNMVETEILENKKKLELLFPRRCLFFSYPNGGIGDFNERHKVILKNAGYKAAVSLTHGRSLHYKDPMDISRINVVPEDTTRSLLFRCTGITPLVNKLKKIYFG